ncbi:hypothetical protein L249_4289 [Ophiocordyceps polyrhachis-furcata BCC 54312]|uniref:Zn(2)-C6 fungal-type domain-containing protein n=1 Tax=Ophiocordyceps polyrhachis-furcata BCC 54312 TaxID=1330021 RepID=A0A367L7X8_9HYPO|nr:hypothetical protein L249_4289 [Ophiocordyceps polyrhachis-furcata BCC 54312]
MLSADPFNHQDQPPNGQCSLSASSSSSSSQSHFPPSRPPWPPSPPFAHLPPCPYPLQPFHHQVPPAAQPPVSAKQQARGGGSKSSSILVRRRRVSRACDRCNQLRTKCDGRQPCAHCIDFNLGCQYMREKKKRGKASRKDLAERAAAAAAAATTSTVADHTSPQQLPTDASEAASWAANSLPSDDSDDGSIDRPHRPPQQPDPNPPQQLHVDVSACEPLPTGQSLPFDVAATASPAFVHPALALGSLPQTCQNGFKFVPAAATYPIASSGWPLHTPPSPSSIHLPTLAHLRYPVLGPLVPHLETAMLPVSLACDLLDFYLSSSSMHPLSPYVLAFVFRRKSLLSTTRPRTCQPALLASMLLVAAQTMLTSCMADRAMVCQRLLDLTLRLLEPLASDLPSDLATPSLGHGLSASGTTDDVATYMHIATVASANEWKPASLRWWNAAWSLARELELGRELPPDGQVLPCERIKLEFEVPSRLVSDEEREERRRLWWLLYMVDRHLALCFNRPLFLLDIECDGLLLPMDDTAWQMGCFEAQHESFAGGSVNKFGALEAPWPDQYRFECRGHGIFGFFLPLMTMLGEVVDLHHAQNQPSCGRDWEARAEEIRRHIDLYEQSLARLGNIQPDNSGRRVEASRSPSSVGANHTTTHDESRTRTVMAYGTHAMHVLHILLAGRWDDDNTCMSSAAFFKAASHAVSAADAVGRILQCDPGLELMPFFFGIYLMQGSLLLPVIAAELRPVALSSVVRACETIVRAHEVCTVTLSTECQRNFSRVMRSALTVARDRAIEEQQQQQQQQLEPFRWTGDGTGGLAL